MTAGSSGSGKGHAGAGLAIAILTLAGCGDDPRASAEPPAGADSREQGRRSALAQARPGEMKLLPQSRVCVREEISSGMQGALASAGIGGLAGATLAALQREAASLGQDNSVPGSGSTRFIRVGGGSDSAQTCKPEGADIQVRLSVTENPQGESYRLTLEARQGNRGWTRTLDRRAGSERPGFAAALSAGEEGPLLSADQSRLHGLVPDIVDLSDQLVSQFGNGVGNAQSKLRTAR